MLQRLQGTYAMNQKILSPSLWRDLIPPCQAKARSQKKHAKARKARRAALRESTRPDTSCMSDALFLWFVQRLAFAGISQVQSVPTHAKYPSVSKDTRKRELDLERDRQRKRAAYAKKKADFAIILGCFGGTPIFGNPLIVVPHHFLWSFRKNHHEEHSVGRKNLIRLGGLPVFLCGRVMTPIGCFRNSGTPKSILIGFSIFFTIHFGVPLFLETPN